MAKIVFLCSTLDDKPVGRSHFRRTQWRLASAPHSSGGTVSSFIRRVAVGAAVLLSAATLAACGSDDDSSDGGGSGGSSDQEITAACKPGQPADERR